MEVAECDMRQYLSYRLVRTTCANGDLLARHTTDDYDGANWLFTMVDVAKALEGGNEPLFNVRNGRLGYERGSMSSRRQLAEHLLKVIQHAPTYIKKHFPYHDYDPRAELFLRLLKQRPGLREGVQREGYKGIPEIAVELCDQLNAFVCEFRTAVRSEGFKREADKCKRSAVKNYNSLKRYVRELFARYARVLVVRVDLYYPSELSGKSVSGKCVDVKEVAEHRAQFMQAIRSSSISKALLGYCWKLEYGLKKGFHFHWLFFFDGSKVRQDVTLGRLIGEVWEGVIGDKNTYWNCNANKHKYSTLGIGMVSHDDAERRQGLDKALAYLTKPDYLLSLSQEKAGRIFGRSERRVSNRRVGRPRRDNDSVIF